MKLLTSLTITIALAALVLAQTSSSSFSDAAQAKQELNEAARAYREGRFKEALARAEKALLLDPQNKTAPYFIARTMHALYRPGITTPENVAQGHEAIVAYQRVLKLFPENDEAFKAIAYLYGALKEDALLTEWLLQRANNVSISNEKRSDAYVHLASRDWDCSFKITQQPNIKVVTVNGDKTFIQHKMPKERAEFEQARECANRGLEMANTAILLVPENESAWTYKSNILLEFWKLSEMQGELQQQREFRRQYEEALRVTTTLLASRKSNP